MNYTGCCGWSLNPVFAPNVRVSWKFVGNTETISDLLSNWNIKQQNVFPDGGRVIKLNKKKKMLYPQETVHLIVIHCAFDLCYSSVIQFSRLTYRFLALNFYYTVGCFCYFVHLLFILHVVLSASQPTEVRGHLSKKINTISHRRQTTLMFPAVEEKYALFSLYLFFFCLLSLF